MFHKARNYFMILFWAHGCTLIRYAVVEGATKARVGLYLFRGIFYEIPDMFQVSKN